MAPINQTGPTSWSIVAVIFISLFVLTLSGMALAIGYLHRQRKQSDLAKAAAPQTDNNPDLLTIAHLKAQLSAQELFSAELDVMIKLMERNQASLEQQLREERRKAEPMAMEVFQRMYDEIHRPLSPARPSLPPLIIGSSSAAPAPPSPATDDGVSPSSVAWGEPTEAILLQTSKLRGVMRSNSGRSPVRETKVVHHFPASGEIVGSGHSDAN